MASNLNFYLPNPKYQIGSKRIKKNLCIIIQIILQRKFHLIVYSSLLIYNSIFQLAKNKKITSRYLLLGTHLLSPCRVYFVQITASHELQIVCSCKQGGNTLRRRNEAKCAQFLSVLGRLVGSRAK